MATLTKGGSYRATASRSANGPRPTRLRTCGAFYCPDTGGSRHLEDLHRNTPPDRVRPHARRNADCASEVQRRRQLDGGAVDPPYAEVSGGSRSFSPAATERGAPGLAPRGTVRAAAGGDGR